MTTRRPPRARQTARTVVERTQTGVRMEKHLLKVLKALAEYHDESLGELLEGIVLHAFAGRPPFGPEGRARIAELSRIYGLTLTLAHSHRMTEAAPAAAARATPAGGARRTGSARGPRRTARRMASARRARRTPDARRARPTAP